MVHELPCLSLNRAGEIVLEIVVAPRASSNRLIGLHADRLKVAVTAPPVDGRANALIIDFLAEVLGTSKRAIVITAGDSGRRKRVTVAGITLEAARSRLLTALAEG